MLRRIRGKLPKSKPICDPSMTKGSGEAMARAKPTSKPVQATSDEEDSRSDTEKATALLGSAPPAPGPSGGIALAPDDPPAAGGPSGGISPKSQSSRRRRSHTTGVKGISAT